MTRHALWTLALGLTLVAPASASTRTYFNFQIGVSNAPPPPVIAFRREPDFVVVPSTQVYVVSSSYDYDMFRYGRNYYVCDDGHWYRARSYHGPFSVVDVRYVPQPIFHVPERHWKHHWKNNGRWNHGEDDHDGGHGQGHGNKHGHKR